MKNEWISQRFVEYFPKKNKILPPPPVPEKIAYFLKFASGRLQDGWFISQARISICR